MEDEYWASGGGSRGRGGQSANCNVVLANCCTKKAIMEGDTKGRNGLAGAVIRNGQSSGQYRLAGHHLGNMTRCHKRNGCTPHLLA